MPRSSLTPLATFEVVSAFGDPWLHMRDDGTVSPMWERETQAYAALPAPLPLSWSPTTMVARLKCHRLIAPLLELAMEDIYNVPEAWASINDTGGAYCFRTVRGSKHSLSRHSWGIAVDLDVGDNRMFAPVHSVHPYVRDAMRRHGFAWGGARVWGGDFSWSRRDPMHFEFADLSAIGV